MSQSNWQLGMAIIQEEWRAFRRGPAPTAADIERLRTGLSHASHSLHVAESVAELSREGRGQRLRQVRSQIGIIQTVLDRAQDAQDVALVIEAIRELRRIGEIRNNPNGAARAFGQLFSSLGRLSSHLPPPADSYADFLAESGDFFTNMNDAYRRRRGDFHSGLQEAQRAARGH